MVLNNPPAEEYRYLVGLVYLDKQDQLDEQNKPDELDRPGWLSSYLQW